MSPRPGPALIVIRFQRRAPPYRRRARRPSMPAARSAARPSQPCGGAGAGVAPASDGISSIAAGSVPIRRLVPCETVTGRSVLSLIVKQGTPRYVVSSWTPPESVITARAFCSRARKSTYPTGGIRRSCGWTTLGPIRCRVRG